MITKLFKTATIFLLFSILILNTYGACVPPPYYYVINPVVTSDGAGGYVIAYQMCNSTGSTLTYLRRLDAQGKNLWGAAGIRLDFSQPGKPETASPTELISDGQGNTLVIWRLDDDIWAQKLDISGNPAWNNKVKVGSCRQPYKLEAIGNDDGGAIIGCYGERGDFWLQNLNGDGKLAWSPGIQMSDIIAFDIKYDASGNILLLYITANHSIYLQKVNLSGDDIWDSPVLLNVPISASLNEIQPTYNFGLTGCASYTPAYCREYTTWVISDKTDGCIVGYADIYKESPLKLHKIDEKGNILWTKSLSSPEDQNAQKDSAWRSRIADDGLGGIFVFHMVVTTAGADTRIIVQHIDSAGNETFNADGGFEVSDNAWNTGYDRRYEVISDNSGGTAVFWVSTRNGSNSSTEAILRGQKIDQAGNKLWDEAGIILSTDEVEDMNESPSIIKDGSDGFIVSIGGRASGVWRIGSDGRELWAKRY